MRQIRTGILCGLIAAAFAAAGCGGDDTGQTGGKSGAKTQRSSAGDTKGAEAAVRDYLGALVGKDGAKACDKLAPEYRKSLLDQNRDFARKAGATDCASLIEAVTRQAPRATFEGQPLNEQTVGTIPLEVTIRLNGKEQNATVTGAQGLQRYELFTADGRWWITEIVQAGG